MREALCILSGCPAGARKGHISIFAMRLHSKKGRLSRPFSLSKKSSKYWAFSDRYGRMGKGDERCWNAGKWIEIW